jgi:hypothetical protein
MARALLKVSRRRGATVAVFVACGLEGADAAGAATALAAAISASSSSPIEGVLMGSQHQGALSRADEMALDAALRAAYGLSVEQEGATPQSAAEAVIAAYHAACAKLSAGVGQQTPGS